MMYVTATHYNLVLIYDVLEEAQATQTLFRRNAAQVFGRAASSTNLLLYTGQAPLDFKLLAMGLSITALDFLDLDYAKVGCVVP